jgi:hypothetical protein
MALKISGLDDMHILRAAFCALLFDTDDRPQPYGPAGQAGPFGCIDDRADVFVGTGRFHGDAALQVNTQKLKAAVFL